MTSRLSTVPVDFSMGALSSKLIATVPIKLQLANYSLTLMDAVVRLRATANGDPRGSSSLRAPSALCCHPMIAPLGLSTLQLSELLAG